MQISETGRWWLLPGLILISGALWVTRSEPVQRLRMGIVSFFRPVQKLLSRPVRHASPPSPALVSHVRELENRLLRERERNWQLSRQLQSLRAFRGEFSDLSVGVVPAEIIGRDTSTLRRTLIVDAGLLDGVALNSAVLVDAALVGRIVDVSARSSRVLMIDDPGSAVPVVVLRTREQGILEGRFDERPKLAFEYIDRLSSLRPGDVVLTSGVGGVFPKGIVIGSVSQVQNEPGTLFKEVYVQPSVHMSRLERVLIWRNRPRRGGDGPNRAPRPSDAGPGGRP